MRADPLTCCRPYHFRLAIIKVGGPSEVEVGKEKGRYDDAVVATCAAVEEGILP